MGILLGVLFTCKRILEFLPNTELVTLLFIVYAYVFGKKTYIISVCFTILETFVWGVHYWVIMYLYIWPLLITVVLLTRRWAGYMFYTVLSGFYGLFFGLLCSIPYYFIGGLSMQVTWWIAGIPFDIIHCVSNFIIALVLYKPVLAVCKKAKIIMEGNID